MTPTRLLLAICLLAPLAVPAAAQAPDSMTSRGPRHIRAWQIGVALGGIAATSLLDNSLQHYIIDHRTQGEQDLAVQWQKWGEGTVPAVITVGTLGAGLVLGKPEVTRTGARLVTSLAGATLVGWGLKKSIGRHRPSEATDQYTFDPFKKFNSFPSGHTITAFAVSTTLADAIHNKWADIGLHTLAFGTGASRLIGNHHWLSDVVGSAVFGTTIAKVVDGRWTIFGLHSPEFLTGPGSYGLRWTADVPALRGGAAPR